MKTTGNRQVDNDALESNQWMVFPMHAVVATEVTLRGGAVPVGGGGGWVAGGVVDTGQGKNLNSPGPAVTRALFPGTSRLVKASLRPSDPGACTAPANVGSESSGCSSSCWGTGSDFQCFLCVCCVVDTCCVFFLPVSAAPLMGRVAAGTPQAGWALPRAPIAAKPSI